MILLQLLWRENNITYIPYQVQCMSSYVSLIGSLWTTCECQTSRDRPGRTTLSSTTATSQLRKVTFTGMAETLGQLSDSNMDFHANCWATLRTLLGQPCEFQAQVSEKGAKLCQKSGQLGGQGPWTQRAGHRPAAGRGWGRPTLGRPGGAH